MELLPKACKRSVIQHRPGNTCVWYRYKRVQLQKYNVGKNAEEIENQIICYPTANIKGDLWMCEGVYEECWMISIGYIICYLQEQNLHGDWVRAEGRLLAHCTTCEESFELNFRGSTKQLSCSAWVLPNSIFGRQAVRKNSSFIFPSLYVIKRSENDPERCKVKATISHYTLEHENGKILHC